MSRFIRWTSPSLVSILLAAACTGGDKAVLPPPKPALPPTPRADAPAAEPGAAVGSAGVPTPAAERAPVTSRFTGEVDAPRRSQIAFRVNGFVAEILAKPGTTLKRGEALATLDDRDYKLRVELAKARLDQAKVQADSAAKDFHREVQLKKENVSTAAAMDKIRAAHDSARLAVRLAELDLEAAELALKDTRLVAPYDCVVAAQMQHEGENVQSGNAVFEIYDTAEPEISLTVPERLIGQVAVGSGLSVSVPSVGFTGKAEVVRLVPVISDKTRTFQVTAKLVEQDGRIVPGSYAEATQD